MSACPACGEQNPERARFCLACGASLAEAAQATEERKVVSVLFVDLVGFTDRSDEADPEDVRAMLRPYHALLKREIERFGGTVEKFIGDAVMAVYGAPVAHEDDAERAVRSALRILEEIPRLNRQSPDLRLQARAAVNTGEAVVALGARPEHGETIVTGDVVNTASRLQQVAPAGGVVVGEITHRATKDMIMYKALRPVSVKGKAGPIAIWHATDARSRFGIDVEQPAAAPLIGREHELALLEQAWARAVREPSVQLVTVTGEPGVGKSRLVSEFRDSVGERVELVHWRQGRCLPYGDGITFWALGEIVKAEAGILESDTAEAAGQKLRLAIAAVVGDASERDWFSAKLAPLVGSAEASGETDREESFAAWRKFLEALAASRPLVVVLEDLHWADEPLLDFVEHLVDWSTDVPLLVACTARPELYERRAGWGGGKRNSTTIALPPLSSDETARLIALLLARSVLPAETHQALVERSGGNPLYAEEFVRMLADRDVTDPDASLPETVHALVAARLDTLPPQRKALLHDAAVVGQVFWAGAVAAIGGIDAGAVRDGVHELVRKELVRPTRTSSVRDDDEFAFWHVLVRDVAYQQIPRAARGQKHRAAAEWIEGIARDRVEDHAEILVHHYGQALDLARAAGSDAEAAALEQPLRRFLVLAGDRAIDLDVTKAEKHYRRALDLLPAGNAQRPHVLVKAGRVAQRLDRLGESVTLLEEAVHEFRSHGDRVAEAAAKLRLEDSVYFLGDHGRAQALMREAIVDLEREPPGPELAEAYRAVAHGQLGKGNAREALTMLEKCAPLAEKFELKPLLAAIREMRGLARVWLGDLDGLEDIRASLALLLKLGAAEEAALTYLSLALTLWPIEGPASALEVQREGIAFAERRGLQGQAMWNRGSMFWMLHDLGEWDEFVRIAEEVEAWRAQRNPAQQSLSMSRRALIHIRRGEVDLAASLQEKFLPASRSWGEVQALVPALAAAALTAQARGNLDSAVALADELERETRGAPGWNRFSVAVDVVRIATAAGDLELGERMLEQEDPAARSRHCAVAGRAVLAEARGSHDEALRLYTDAAHRWREFGYVFEHGQALLGAGRCLLALGDHAHARSRLADAREIFAWLRAEPSLRETHNALQQASAPTG